MYHTLKKSSKNSFLLMAIALIAITSSVYSQKHKKKYKKKKTPVSKIDTSGYKGPHIIYHAKGISKEDSTKLAIIEAKQDISYYIFLKNRVQPAVSYIDSLFNIGFKINGEEYLKLKRVYESEMREMKKQNK